MTQKDTVANTYVGKLSGKLHLEVRGITLATEGDLCRDATLSTHSERWTAELLSMVRDVINGGGNMNERMCHDDLPQERDALRAIITNAKDALDRVAPAMSQEAFDALANALNP